MTTEKVNQKNDYEKNYLRNVKEEGIVEKKGKYNYISWSHCEKMGNELAEDFD